MTLILKISVIVIRIGAILQRFKSLRFDFCVFNFDTMKVILFGKAPKSLMVSYFLQKEKERKYRINTCVPIWSEWGDLNSRPLGPEPSALPTALHPEIIFAIIISEVGIVKNYLRIYLPRIVRFLMM